MQNLSLAELWSEQHPSQSRIVVDLSLRTNPSKSQFCLLSLWSLCSSKSAKLTQESGVFQQIIPTPHPPWGSISLSWRVEKRHSHPSFTLATEAYWGPISSEQVSGTWGAEGCCSQELLPGRQWQSIKNSHILRHYVISAHLITLHKLVIIANHNNNSNNIK